MTKNIIIFALVALAACGNITPSGDITAVNTPTNGGLEGGSNTGSANITLKTCTSGKILEFNGTSWACITTPTSGTGDITDVIAGNGLINGGTSGAVTLDVACGTGITCNANDITLNLAAGDVVQTTTSTGTQSDFAINAGTTVLKFTGTSNLTLTGLAVSGGNVDGRTIKIVNASTNNSTITFVNNLTSTAANRFQTAPTGFNVAIGGRTSTLAIYDSTASRWNLSKETSGTFTRLAVWTSESGLGTSIIEDNGSTATVNGALNTTGNITENSVRVFTVAGNGLTSTGGTVNAVCLTGLTCNADSIQIADRDFTDITASSSGSVLTIDNDVVTYAKMQNVSATSRIMCRKTAGAGDMEECTASDANTILGTPTGSGTNNTLVKWTGTNTQGNSNVTDNGTTVAVTGILTTTGAASIGSSLVAGTYMQAGTHLYAGTTSGVYMLGTQGSINFGLNTNAAFTGYINAVGYNESTTQTRSLGIADGTGTTSADLIVFFDGTNRSTLFYQDVTMGDATTDQVVVAGDLTVNDDTTLTDQLQVQGHTTLGNGAVDVVAFNNSEPKDVGTVPSTGAMTCGTSPTVTGGRFSFNVHTGTGLASTCVIPFSTAFANTPTCTVSAENKVAAVNISALSTSSISVTEGTGGDISDANIYIICIGH